MPLKSLLTSNFGSSHPDDHGIQMTSLVILSSECSNNLGMAKLS
jgi:hypothetical protein